MPASLLAGRQATLPAARRLNTHYPTSSTLGQFPRHSPSRQFAPSLQACSTNATVASCHRSGSQGAVVNQSDRVWSPLCLRGSAWAPLARSLWHIARRRARTSLRQPPADQHRPYHRLVVQCTGQAYPGVTMASRPYTAVMIVPTGVGAAIGGYAGDAIPVARALASAVDRLITHPNVLNGAMLYWPMPNVLYVEGYGLDCFAAGHWGLQPVHQNRIALVLDAAIEDNLRLRHLQVADATAATLGLPLVDYAITDQPLQVESWIDPATGASTGRLGRPDSLLRAAERLVTAGGAEAVAVVARFPDDDVEDLEDYRKGEGVDCLAGVEAIISHMVVEHLHVPCAHAPALAPLPLDEAISPRSAAEELGHTFLPCVLAGLSRAPQFVTPTGENGKPGGGASPHPGGSGVIWGDEVDAVIVPAGACNGPGTLSFARQERRKPLIIAVEENQTVLSDTPERLGINAFRVANYWEAIGVLTAHKSGVNPWSLRRDGVKHIAQTRLPREKRMQDASLRRRWSSLAESHDFVS